MAITPKLHFYIVCLKCDEELEIAETQRLHIKQGERSSYLNADILTTVTKYDTVRFMQKHVNESCAVLDRSSPFSIIVR